MPGGARDPESGGKDWLSSTRCCPEEIDSAFKKGGPRKICSIKSQQEVWEQMQKERPDNGERVWLSGRRWGVCWWQEMGCRRTLKTVHKERRGLEGHWLAHKTNKIRSGLDRDISIPLTTFLPPLSSFSLLPSCRCSNLSLGATSVGKMPFRKPSNNDEV